MKKAILPRIGGIAAAIALTVSMAACAGGQSVADACKIANDEMTKATSSINSDVNAAMQKATQGEKVDFAEIFKPVTEGLDKATSKVTNEKVKKPLDAFATEYKNFTKSFEGFEMPDMKNIDASDPAAMEKLQQASEKAQEISKNAQAASTKLVDQGKKIQEVCNAG
ncbi:hypothetical protein AB3K78_08680 [Leucobacter sp. HNU]|uniref:hypothetical protein n=1 Tax=Leucobacter sp. HNU TaxID=3236805 RepID=UPI003A80C3E8